MGLVLNSQLIAFKVTFAVIVSAIMKETLCIHSMNEKREAKFSKPFFSNLVHVFLQWFAQREVQYAKLYNINSIHVLILRFKSHPVYPFLIT